LFLSSCAHLRDLPSFPTRRSSDLGLPLELARKMLPLRSRFHLHTYLHLRLHGALASGTQKQAAAPVFSKTRLQHLLRSLRDAVRSEEHTSELQSRSDLVCRLLLEK